jgi:hypothetical protein
VSKNADMATGMPERDRLIDGLHTMRDPSDVNSVDAALAGLRAALAAASDGERSRPAYVLAMALNQRFIRTGDLADMWEAVSFLRVAVEDADGDPFHARYVSELSAALLDLAHTHNQPVAGLADEAVRLADLAVALTPEGHPQQAARMAMHGLALSRRGHSARNHADLDSGINLLREALGRCHAVDPRRGSYHLMAATALMLRYDLAPNDADPEEAHRHVEIGAFVSHPYEPATAHFKGAYASIRGVRLARRRRG